MAQTSFYPPGRTCGDFYCFGHGQCTSIQGNLFPCVQFIDMPYNANLQCYGLQEASPPTVASMHSL